MHEMTPEVSILNSDSNRSLFKDEIGGILAENIVIEDFRDEEAVP